MGDVDHRLVVAQRAGDALAFLLSGMPAANRPLFASLMTWLMENKDANRDIKAVVTDLIALMLREVGNGRVE
jgi:hypothetical protein